MSEILLVLPYSMFTTEGLPQEAPTIYLSRSWTVGIHSLLPTFFKSNNLYIKNYY